MIVSYAAFTWFITIAVTLFSVTWGIIDLVRLRRALSSAAPDRSDRIFGSVVGLLLVVLGLVGVWRFRF